MMVYLFNNNKKSPKIKGCPYAVSAESLMAGGVAHGLVNKSFYPSLYREQGIYNVIDDNNIKWV